MGKILVINNADFSSVALDKVTPSDEPSKTITWYSDNNRTYNDNGSYSNSSKSELGYGFTGYGNHIDSSLFGKTINRIRTRFYSGGDLVDIYKDRIYAVYKIVGESEYGPLVSIDQITTFTISKEEFVASEKIIELPVNITLNSEYETLTVGIETTYTTPYNEFLPVGRKDATGAAGYAYVRPDDNYLSSFEQLLEYGIFKYYDCLPALDYGYYEE